MTAGLRNELFSLIADLADAQAEWYTADGVAQWDVNGECQALERDIVKTAQADMADQGVVTLDALMMCTAALCWFARKDPEGWYEFTCGVHEDFEP